MTHVVHPRGSRQTSGSLAGLRLCMVMHVGSGGLSRVAAPAGPPARLGNRPTPVNGCPQRILLRDHQSDVGQRQCAPMTVPIS